MSGVFLGLFEWPLVGDVDLEVSESGSTQKNKTNCLLVDQRIERENL